MTRGSFGPVMFEVRNGSIAVNNNQHSLQEDEELDWNSFEFQTTTTTPPPPPPMPLQSVMEVRDTNNMNS